ncbi:hypothetical protein V8C42DRAFT_331658 [Trichoderma barbatum]
MHVILAKSKSAQGSTHLLQSGVWLLLGCMPRTISSRQLQAIHPNAAELFTGMAVWRILLYQWRISTADDSSHFCNTTTVQYEHDDNGCNLLPDFMSLQEHMQLIEPLTFTE